MNFACLLCAGGRQRALFEKHGLGYVRCEGCGLVQRHPLPTSEELLRAYGEETIYAERLQKGAEIFLDRERELLAESRRREPQDRSSTSEPARV